jgi:hypothetical protein
MYRLAASRDAAVAVHKQALLKLRRHLAEQDKKFQQAQLDLQAKHIELKVIVTSIYAQSSLFK